MSYISHNTEPGFSTTGPIILYFIKKKISEKINSVKRLCTADQSFSLLFCEWLLSPAEYSPWTVFADWPVCVLMSVWWQIDGVWGCALCLTDVFVSEGAKTLIRGHTHSRTSVAVDTLMDLVVAPAGKRYCSGLLHVSSSSSLSWPFYTVMCVCDEINGL